MCVCERERKEECVYDSLRERERVGEKGYECVCDRRRGGDKTRREEIRDNWRMMHRRSERGFLSGRKEY